MTDAGALERAYAECRAISRREAKNFYYAFVALPAPRRNAICAIYAFMRQADDLSDDESISREERRRRLDAWLNEWRSICHGGDSSNLVFIAVRDAVERYNIPLSLLDELVAGNRFGMGCEYNRHGSLRLPGGRTRINRSLVQAGTTAAVNTHISPDPRHRFPGYGLPGIGSAAPERLLLTNTVSNSWVRQV